MRKSFLALSLSALLAASFSASAQATPPKPDDKVPAAVQLAVMGGMKVETSFPAAGGLTGWVLSQGVGNNIVVFTPPGGEVAIAGNMLDSKGANLTKQYLEQYAPKPDYAKLWNELEKTTWISEGTPHKKAKSVIYVFEDPNCGYCHQAWTVLQPYEKAGLEVRWVPVAFLAADSMNKAGATLTAADPSAAFHDMQEKWGMKLPYPAPSLDVRAKLEANNELMKNWGFRGTPATLYKDKEGKVHAVNGMWQPDELASITGMTLPAEAGKKAP